MAAKKVLAYTTGDVQGGPHKASAAATLLQGTVVGLNSGGEIVLADYRVGQGPIQARGFLTQNANRTDPKGNVLFMEPRGGFVDRGRVTGFGTLIPGLAYYLHTGGGITINKPATATNDIDQQVGYAIDADVLVIDISDPVKKA